MVLRVTLRSFYRGTNFYGELGRPTSTSPTQVYGMASVSLPGKVIVVAAGLNFGVAALISGDVYAWGRNDRQQVIISRGYK